MKFLFVAALVLAVSVQNASAVPSIEIEWIHTQLPYLPVTDTDTVLLGFPKYDPTVTFAATVDFTSYSSASDYQNGVESSATVAEPIIGTSIAGSDLSTFLTVPTITPLDNGDIFRLSTITVTISPQTNFVPQKFCFGQMKVTLKGLPPRSFPPPTASTADVTYEEYFQRSASPSCTKLVPSTPFEVKFYPIARTCKAVGTKFADGGEGIYGKCTNDLGDNAVGSNRVDAIADLLNRVYRAQGERFTDI